MSVAVMAALWKHSGHSGSALLMLLAIADFADDDGRAYPSVARLAQKCRVKPRAANYTLRDLQDSGELEVRIGGGPMGAHGPTNLYRIALKRLGLQRVAEVQSIAALQGVAQPGAKDCAEPLHRIADKPSLNHQEPPVGRKPKAPACPHDELLSLYHEILPELPTVRFLGPKRKEALTKFWQFIFTQPKSDGQPRAATAQEAVAWTRSYFSRARDNDFLMGRTARTEEHANWHCSLDYLLTERGMSQVIEKTAVTA